MSEHFRAFSFVDRIVPGHDDSHIEGCYAIPSGLDGFPSSLAAEAVGQLAAWAAMNAMGFERRPIAGLAGRVDLLAAAQPGQVLQLAVDFESLDAEAAAYSGCATIDGSLIIRLVECVGPMVQVADLDDPAALRERFALLSGPGAPPGCFRGLPLLVLHRTDGEAGQWVRAAFQVPASAAMFADHFPRRPVFPGSLLVQLSLELAATLAAELPPPTLSRWEIRSVLDMKLREFIPPGRDLELEAKLKQRTGDSATLTVRVRTGGEIVASTCLLLAPEGCA